MANTPKPFRFLTTEEFNRLSDEQKMTYLVRASETLNRRSAETSKMIGDLLRKPPPKTGK